MNRIMIFALAAALFNVVFATNLHCDKCARKIEDNIAFEKGVKDLKVSVDDKTVAITFDSAKTDTLKLGKAIRRLGYSAKVVSYAPVKSKRK